MNTSALLIGGVIPAMLFGAGTVQVPYSIGAGASPASYLATAGSVIAAVGWLATMASGGLSGGGRALGAAAAAMGLTWAAAIACMSYGFGTLRMPVSVVAPLTNSNALVAVVLGAVLFGEWSHLDGTRVLGGTLLMCCGAALVSTAKA